MRCDFSKGFSVDAELKRTADLTEYSNDDYKIENYLALGVKYSF